MGDLALAQLADAYMVYIDPISEEQWVSLPDGSCSFDKHALQIANSIRAFQPQASLACDHSSTLFNGPPWETDDGIGRHLALTNAIVMHDVAAHAWHMRLFLGAHAAEPRFDVLAAMTDRKYIEWSSMTTHKGRYQGLLAKCSRCKRCCRVAWNPRFSTAYHFYEQRNLLCSFLKVEPMAAVPMAPKTVV